MTGLRYEAPETLDAAVALLGGAGGNARVMAGGTDLIIQMDNEMIEPDLLVDIKNLKELCSVEQVDGGYRIGAAVTGMELMEHEGFCATWPGVIDGVKLIGSIQVKGRATVGGNVCNASPAADSTPALIAAGATATVVGSNGSRDVLVEDICVGPGKTSLADDEIVVTFNFAQQPANYGSAYQRFTPRTEMDIAVVGVGIGLTLDDSGTCTAARVSLGAVAATPLLVDEAAATLIGTKVDEAALDNLSAAASAACKPIDDKRGTIEFRTDVAGVLARRVALDALERARKS